MIKVIIRNELSQITNIGLEESQELAEAWVASNANSFPSNYSASYEDITLQKQIETDEKKEEQYILCGVKVIAKIRRINKSKLGSSNDVDDFMDIPIVIKILKHLSAGNLETARDIIVATDLTSLFTSDEKTEVVDYLNNILDLLEG